MFCKKCGIEMSEKARFCSKCGNDRLGGIKQDKKIVETDEIIYQLFPKFNLPYKILCKIGRILLFFLIVHYFIIIRGIKIYIYPINILVLGIIILYIEISLYFENLKYKSLQYNFYTTKMVYKEVAFKREEKEVKYRGIEKVIMYQNIFEQIFNCGKIQIVTNDSMINANRRKFGSRRYYDRYRLAGKSGIYIYCAGNINEQYKKIKEIIDEGMSKE